MKIKRVIASSIAAIMIFAGFATASGAEPRIVNVILDGKRVDFIDTDAQIIHDYTYVPIARIIEILTGEPPDWDAANKMASFKFNGQSFMIYTNQKGIYIDGVFKEFDTYPEIVNSRTLIPLRMLSDALGFGISWDGATSTVTLTSPAPPPTSATVISVEPSNTAINSGETITARVIATSSTSEVKIVDSGNNFVTSTKAFTASGTNRLFTLTFKPSNPGVFTVYAAGINGYNITGSKSINVAFNSQAVINSISLSSNSVILNNSVTLTVYTNSEATRVKLVSNLNGSDTAESTNYTTSGNQRIFTLTWRVKSSYYSGRSTVSAKVYAGTSSGYSSNYRTISVDIGQDAPTIYEAYPAFSDIEVDSATDIYVTTSSDVTSLTFSITSGGGSLQHTRVSSHSSSSGSKRYWENTFFAGNYDGTSKISVTANTPGSSASTSFSIRVTGESADANIYSFTANKYDYSPGETVKLEVVTGTSAVNVVGSDGMAGSGSFDFKNTSTSGGRKTWTYSYKLPNNAIDGMTFYVESYDLSGRTADSDTTSIDIDSYQ